MITIVSEPQAITPAFNPVIVKVVSDEQARTDFKYIIKVYDGAANLLQTMKKVGSSTVTDVISIDLSGALAQLQTFNSWRYNITPGEPCYVDANFKKEYSFIISEYYDLDIQDEQIVLGKFTIPAALHSIKFPFYDYSVLKTTGRWLTNFNRFRVRDTDKLTVSYLCPDADNVLTSFLYNFYNKDGVNIHTTSMSFALFPVIEDVVHIHLGLQEVFAYIGADLDVSYFTIKGVNGTSDMPSITVNVICENSKFPGIRAHYINEWGATDSFLFNLAYRRGVSIEKKKAKLKFEGSILRPAIYGAGTTPYAVHYTDKLKLVSQYISDNDSTALLELFTSPIVSVEVPSKIFFPATDDKRVILPCDIEVKDYDVKQSNVNKMFNLELEVEISVDNTRQTL